MVYLAFVCSIDSFVNSGSGPLEGTLVVWWVGWAKRDKITGTPD